MDPNRPFMTPREARRFTKEYMTLNKMISNQLVAAETMGEAKQGLDMLKEMAKYELPQAKTFYGLALLMEGKPWYDVEMGTKWLRRGAEEAEVAEHDASYSMYQYGLMLLDGLQGVQQDHIHGKFWMEKAADAGFRPAIKEQKKRWNNMEKETKKKSTWLAGIIAIVLLAGIIGFAVYEHKQTEKAVKAGQEWAEQMKEPWKKMEIKTNQDVMRANSMINSSNLSDEEKQKASIWVYQEYAKNKNQ